MTNEQPTPKTAADCLLVGLGKSSRLQAMREKALQIKTMPVAKVQECPPQENSGFSPDFLLIRQLIDERLREILATLPATKQQSLFKIRFGVKPSEIRSLPVKQIVRLQAIKHPQ